MDYHDKTIKELHIVFNSSNDGLASNEAQNRLIKHGLNKIEEIKPISPIKLFLNQFKDLLVIILLISAFLTAIIGIIETDSEAIIDVVAIGLVVMLNAILGFYQEFSAEKSIKALRSLTQSEIVVVRDHKKVSIPVENLVLGDIVVIDAGNIVPADLRIIQGYEVKVNESILTGESLPVKKRDAVLPVKIALADRINLLFSGTTIVNGSGLGLAVAVGNNTELGKIAKSLSEITSDKTPIQEKLELLAKQLTGLVVLLSLFVIIFGTIIMPESSISELFIFSIGLAVAAVPEGLPAVLTLTLAIGVTRMARKNALIRKLPAVEVLGSATIICSDKTGTLTKNEMTVQKIWMIDNTFQVTGTGYMNNGKIVDNNSLENVHPLNFDMKSGLRNLIEICSIVNEATIRYSTTNSQMEAIGDPTEISLLVMAEKANLYKEKLDQLWTREYLFPFDSDRKRMSAIVKNEKEDYHRIMIKGALDVLLSLCTSAYSNNQKIPLSTKLREQILQYSSQYSRNYSYRILGVAFRDIESDKAERLVLSEDYEGVEQDLVFLGFVAIIDPPRDQSAPAIAIAHQAGIRVIMITGDHPDTAMAIGNQIGLCTTDEEDLITGLKLDEMTNTELENSLANSNIFARVSPSHKLRIVDALKNQGEVVIMTGDGVNDAPALKRADVGVAMGIAGTDVSKEASDMVLVDDNFANIIDSISEGRVIYDNMKKFIAFLLSANAGEIVTVLFGLILGYLFLGYGIIPITAVQLLYINIVTDTFPALALGVDNPEEDVMKRSPRNPKEPLIDKNILSMVVTSGLIFAISSLFCFFYALDFNLKNFDPINNPELAHYAETMTFAALVFYQFVHAINTSQRKTIFTWETLKNRVLIGSIILGIILLLFAIYIPFLHPFLDTTELSFYDWDIIIISSIPLVIFEEIRKKIYIKEDQNEERKRNKGSSC